MSGKPRIIWVDFETRSDLGIEVGTERYIHTPHSDIVMMSWAIDNFPAQVWLPSRDRFCPIKLQPTDIVRAFNIQFDWRVWNVLGRKYLFPNLPIEQCEDVMALAGRYTFPQGLEFLGRVLKLKLEKIPISKKLMKKICQPPFEYTQQEFNEFMRYCRGDVESMREAVSQMPGDALSPEEREVWLDTVWVNQTGIPVDVEFAKRVIEVVNYHKARTIKDLPSLTSGMVEKPTQVARIKKWLAEEAGIVVDSLAAPVLDELIQGLDARRTLTPVMKARVRRVLELRQEFGVSSVAKYSKILEGAFNGRIYTNLRYYGASTGRFAGLGVQGHNLPRSKIDDPEVEVAKFMDASILSGDPMGAAKANVRSAICAPKGMAFGVADFSSVENIGLSWVAGQWDIVENFSNGIDEYRQFATQLWPGLAYEDVTKEQRNFCKPGVLGAGYGLGWLGLIEYAAGMGVTLQPLEAQNIIKTYRANRRQVVNFWYRCKDAAVAAIQNPGAVYAYNNCKFRVVLDRVKRKWMLLTLPSGRNLFYCDPEVEEDKYGWAPTHMGIDSKTKQWIRLRLIPGRITENIVQAICRDLLVHAVHQLRVSGYTIVLHVHDEIITLLPQNDKTPELFENQVKIMCAGPAWADGMPIKANGAVLGRYKKL